MSYNNNSSYGQGGYGQYDQYSQSNPYNQSGGNYGQGEYGQPQQPYGQQTSAYSQPTRPGIQQQSSSQYDEERNTGYEMSNVGGRSNDPNRILNDIRTVSDTIKQLEGEISTLTRKRQAFLDDPSASSDRARSDALDQDSAHIMRTFTNLTNRVNTIKKDPESGHPRNSAQVGKVKRDLQLAINEFQQVEAAFRKKCTEQIRRQVEIVRPDATPEEIGEIVDSGNSQVFSQALMQSNRRGEAQSTLRNVETRHAAIQKIERDLIVLAQLFQDLEAAVVQQEAAIEQIEVHGERINQDVQKANTELTGAVEKAKAARRKKWYCLGIIVLILIIIAIVVAVAVTVTNRNNGGNNNNRT